MLRHETKLKRFAGIALILGLTGVQPAHAGMTPNSQPLQIGFTPISFISPANFSASLIDEAKKKVAIANFCATIETYFKKYKWTEQPCGKIVWKADLSTPAGHPLIYASFGDGEETTLVLGGVHPDELTPIPLAFRVARHLQENEQAFKDKGIRVILAPLVNPDGFLKATPTRTNANGIDLNRNFFTIDWYEKAKPLWQRRRQRVVRHFPGYFPNSEVETLFQIQLIDQFKPDKILSIHAPLGFLDYDGPDERKADYLSATEKRAKQLVHSISKESQNYKVVDYTFFSGSLGNYAGNERRIPTVTLELETTDPRMLDTYWKKFLPGILQSFHFPFTSTKDLVGGGNASPFSVDYQIASKETI